MRFWDLANRLICHDFILKQRLSLVIMPFIICSGCASRLPDITYRLTLEVKTSQGTSQGYSTVNIKPYINKSFPGPESGGIRYSVTGEATPVLLRDNRYVFALLSWDGPKPDRFLDMLLASYSQELPPEPRGTSGKRITAARIERLRALASQTSVKTIPISFRPIVAMFGDISDRNTIHAAGYGNVNKIEKNLELVSMKVQIMPNAPQSNNITRILPWMKPSLSGYFQPQARRDANPNLEKHTHISYNDFIM